MRRFGPLLALLVLLLACLAGAADAAYKLGRNCSNEYELVDCGPFVCEHGHCRECLSDHECSVNGQRQCQQHFYAESDEDLNLCLHKPITDVQWQDIVLYVFIFLGSALSIFAGVGTALLHMTALYFLGSFSFSEAVALAQIASLSMSVVAFANNIWRKSSKTGRPIVDLSASMLLLPLMLGSIGLGVILSYLFPQGILVTIWGVVFFVLSCSFLPMGVNSYRKESYLLLPVQSSIGVATAEGIIIEPPMFWGNKSKPDRRRSEHENPLDRMVAQQSRLSAAKSLFLAGTMLVLLFLYVLKSGVYGEELFPVSRCSLIDWILTVTCLLASVLVALAVMHWLRREHRSKKQLGYPFVTGDLVWTKRHTLYYPWWAMGAGTAEGMLGAGFSIVTARILLEMGAEPNIAAATNLFMVFVNSLVSCTVYAVSQTVRWDYGGACLGLGAAGAVAGIVITRFATRNGKTSPILFGLSLAALAISGVTLAVGASETTREITSGHKFGVHMFC